LRIIIGTEDVTSYIDTNFTFSSVDPGGYEMCSLPIPKDMGQTLRGMPIRIDCGLQVAWEGRVAQPQRSLGNRTTITGEGNGALLKDNVAAQIFVDRNLTSWQGPSVQRQINLVGLGYSPTSGQVSADATTGNPSLALSATGPWTTGGFPDAEAFYDAQGVPIASIYYNIVFGANALGSFGATVYLVTTDTGAVGDSSGSITANTSGMLAATAGNRTYAQLQALDAGIGGVANTLYVVYFENLAVYGNHGLAIQGGAPNGFFPSQIVGWTLGQARGLQAGVIPQTDATGYVIPQSVYLTPVSLDQIVGDMAKAAGWHWGVWESQAPLTGNPLPRLDFRPRAVQGQYSASCFRYQCETCDIREDLSGMYDTAVITFNDPSGISRAVTVTADNPVLDAAGIHRSVVLNGGMMLAADAEIFGAMALDLLYTQTRVAGSIDIGVAIDSLAGPMPAWLLKPGIDRLRVIDLPSTDAFGVYSDIPIQRMECRGGTDGFKTSLAVGSGANLVESLQSRLTAAATVGLQG
jgi:hypothetical protein